MPDVKLGNRHECSECGTKFYDLGRPKALCPKCGTEDESRDSESTSRRRRKPVAKDPDLDQDLNGDEELDELEDESIDEDDDEDDDDDDDEDDDDDDDDEGDDDELDAAVGEIEGVDRDELDAAELGDLEADDTDVGKDDFDEDEDEDEDEDDEDDDEL